VAGLLAPQSTATVAYAISLPDLVRASEHIVVAVPTSSQSHWETVGDSRRIVTDTELMVSRRLGGNAAPAESLEVRTLGGTVDEIAQIVPGEARLRTGTEAVVFLDAARDGRLHVTAMAQGHYPLLPDAKGILRLSPSPALDGLRGSSACAITELSGRSVLEAHTLLGTVKKSL
jgi:hypothetical protein